MTKTSTAKPKPITFRVVKGTNERVNIETGVMISNEGGARGDGYAVWTPQREGFRSYSFDTLAEARTFAIAEAEWQRTLIAEAYDAAVIEIYDTLHAVEVPVANRAAEYPALAQTLAAAWRSYDAGFFPAANERMMRVVNHLSGSALLPTAAETEAARLAADKAMPVGTLVRAPGRGLAYVEGPAFVFAEFGRVVVPLRFAMSAARVTSGYGSAFAEDVEVV